MRRAYQTDLSDAEWTYIKSPKSLPPKLPDDPEYIPYGRYLTPSSTYSAAVAPGVSYLMTSHLGRPSSITSELLGAIYGTWERMHAALARAGARAYGQRDPQPSAGIVDSQTVESTGVGGEQRGYDGGEKVKGILSATCS